MDTKKQTIAGNEKGGRNDMSKLLVAGGGLVIGSVAGVSQQTPQVRNNTRLHLNQLSLLPSTRMEKTRLRQTTPTLVILATLHLPMRWHNR